MSVKETAIIQFLMEPRYSNVDLKNGHVFAEETTYEFLYDGVAE